MLHGGGSLEQAEGSKQLKCAYDLPVWVAMVVADYSG
jgi:hypothetical protein